MGFIMLSLVIAELVFTFNQLKKDYDGSALLSEKQANTKYAKQLIKSITLHGKKPRPKNKIRSKIFQIVATPYGAIFNFIILLHVLFNSVTMTIDFSFNTPALEYY